MSKICGPTHCHDLGMAIAIGSTAACGVGPAPFVRLRERHARAMAATGFTLRATNAGVGEAP